MKIIIGAGNTTIDGWISTQETELNVLNRSDFEHIFNGRISAMLAEHVWEHMTKEEGIIAAKNCFDYLEFGGYLRVAVPDLNFKNEWYQNMVKIGGNGDPEHPAYTHKIVYDYILFKEVFESVGFIVDLLEYCDAEGNFHYKYWNEADGKIGRSFRFDTRNSINSLGMVSIILDAKKLYSDRNNFADVYPFMPYQFNLLGSVLTSIRTHGASGKHLAEGERSRLALYKESAMKIMTEEPGTLVPFNMFYDALEQFLDHSHRGVISRALDNDYLNPNKQSDCFDVNVLKTLFLIKYVKEIAVNVENITSLMVSSIDTDRIELLKNIEESLKRLVRQTLVQKNGDLYVFLTDEEKEINREIETHNVEIAEVINKVSELIFNGLYEEKKYRYPAFNGRYAFGFNQIVDDRPYCYPLYSHF